MSSATQIEARTYHASAKINLHLSVTGRRPDGYHELISVVALLAFGDTLHVERAEDSPATDILRCEGIPVESGSDNLILRALSAYRSVAPLPTLKLRLRKRIPVGAGLGGGSSDAAAALRAANAFSPDPLSHERLCALAALIGSDCPLFLVGQPAIIRGRGEHVEPLPEHVAKALRKRRVVVFHPGFPIATGWAFKRISEEQDFDDPAGVERVLESWINDPVDRFETILYNRFERSIWDKFCACSAFVDQIVADGWPKPYLTGSGSAAYLFPTPDNSSIQFLADTLHDCYGPGAFLTETVFLYPNH